MIDLEPLKKAAEAATPGPWESDWQDGNSMCWISDAKDEMSLRLEMFQCSGRFKGRKARFESEMTANSAYLTSFNPTAVLELIRELEQVRIGNERYEKVRRLSVRDYADLHQASPKGYDQFDDLVDALPSHKEKT